MKESEDADSDYIPSSDGEDTESDDDYESEEEEEEKHVEQKPTQQPAACLKAMTTFLADFNDVVLMNE
jgi:hypothetical protein